MIMLPEETKTKILLVSKVRSLRKIPTKFFRIVKGIILRSWIKITNVFIEHKEDPNLGRFSNFLSSFLQITINGRISRQLLLIFQLLGLSGEMVWSVNTHSMWDQSKTTNAGCMDKNGHILTQASLSTYCLKEIRWHDKKIWDFIPN